MYRRKEFSQLVVFTGKIVLAVEVVPMEDKWRDIQRRGAVAGITMASPGMYIFLSLSLSLSLSLFLSLLPSPLSNLSSSLQSSNFKN
jgi:hypothetical protein